MFRYTFMIAATCAFSLSVAAQHQHGSPAIPAEPKTTAPTTAAPSIAPPATAKPPMRLTTSLDTGLENYRRFKVDEPLLDWRATNNSVQTIGGWRSYAKEAMRANAASGETK